MTFADVSAAFLASNEAGIVDEFAILYLINVCRPPHAALSPGRCVRQRARPALPRTTKAPHTPCGPGTLR